MRVWTAVNPLLFIVLLLPGLWRPIMCYNFYYKLFVYVVWMVCESMRYAGGECMALHNAREFEVREERWVMLMKETAIDVEYLPILRYKNNNITNNCNNTQLLYKILLVKWIIQWDWECRWIIQRARSASWIIQLTFEVELDNSFHQQNHIIIVLCFFLSLNIYLRRNSEDSKEPTLLSLLYLGKPKWL